MPGTAERLCHKGLLFRAQDTLNNNSLGKKHSWQDRVSRSSSPLKTGKWGPFPCLNPSCGQQWPWSWRTRVPTRLCPVVSASLPAWPSTWAVFARFILQTGPCWRAGDRGPRPGEAHLGEGQGTLHSQAP